MNKRTVTFRVDAQKRKALDAIAAGIDRDRSYVLNEAIDNYLDVHRWQVAHIKEGLRQADHGDFVADAKVSSAFARWRK
ncbi:MAG: CopG family transcriptional regulator [Elusimicrobia bacterium RBG_16_66_12]|nr:MAG: CopG family transcriptional regulator [Elusimicrobia bacterium RBG_16_66_12]